MLFLVSTLFRVSYLEKVFYYYYYYYYFFLRKKIKNNNNNLPKNDFIRDIFFRTAKEEQSYA